MLQETQRFHPSYSTILNIPHIDTRTGSRHLTFTCTVCSLSWRCRFLGIGSLLTEGRLPPNLSLICCNDRVIFGELRLVGIILSLCSQTMLTVDIKSKGQVRVIWSVLLFHCNSLSSVFGRSDESGLVLNFFITSPSCSHVSRLLRRKTSRIWGSRPEAI